MMSSNVLRCPVFGSKNALIRRLSPPMKAFFELFRCFDVCNVLVSIRALRGRPFHRFIS